MKNIKIIIIVTLIGFGIITATLLQYHLSVAANEYLRLSEIEAVCTSKQGSYGNGKCFIDGKELNIKVEEK